MAGRRAVRVRAFAKINLSLRILGVRPDGYHDLRTVVQSVGWHDTLVVDVAPGAFSLECDDPACPTDSANLVWRAAEAVWATRSRGALRDVRVRIAKRIPMQAGLGGGSSDAAAAIRALSALWRVDLARDRLQAIAAAIGADVPFFLDAGTSLGVERGDVLYPLVDAPPAWVVIAVPPFGVDTAAAYGWFDQSVTSSLISRGAPPPLADASRARRASRLRPLAWPQAPLSLSGTSSDRRGAESPALHRRPQAVNDLQAPVAARHPEIARLVRALRREGASHAAMSGSGSAVFGLFARRAEAARAARRLAGRGRRVVVTRTIDRARFARLSRPVFS